MNNAFCTNCGAPLGQNDQCCPRCGMPIARQPQQPQQPQQQQYQQPQYNYAPAPNYADSSTYSMASGQNLKYVVLQVTLKEKFIGTGSGNLTELEACINAQAAKGYRLHTITTSNGGSKGMLGGDRIQATMVFERID